MGKSTLIEKLVQENIKAEYLSLDDHAVLFASSKDPYGFLESYKIPLAIDEIQRNTDLIMDSKHLVDIRKLPSQFLLTGSANILAMPKVFESLAGRMICHTLWPLSL